MATTKTTANTATPEKKEVIKPEAKVEKKTITAVTSAAKGETKTEVKVAPAPKTEVKKAEPKKETPAVKKVEPAKKDKKAKAPYVSEGEIRVELVHSTASCTKRQIKTVQALGLKKINDTKIHKDNPAIRGMVNLVAHLVTVEKVK